MNFGKWIVVAFVLFAIFIATLVTVCVRQEIPLVTKEYYNEELKYQEQIERNQNTAQLSSMPTIEISGEDLVITYDHLANIENGELKLFRPSDPDLDQQFKVEASSQVAQRFSLGDVQRGLYRARLSWEQAGKEYYLEKIIVL